MIDLVFAGGKFFHPAPEQVESLHSLLPAIKKGFKILVAIKRSEILDLFQAYSKALLKDPSTRSIEGVAFLSNWLRKSNISRIIEKNVRSLEYLETFVGSKKRLKAQPRGIVCHWIAGNVPTLGLFSLFQSMIAGNANVLRVPRESHETMVRLLEVFARTSIPSGLTGATLLESVLVIYFPSSVLAANNELSSIADARVVWGGKEAVDAITNLPKQTHCEDVVFGPKYSIAIFDAGAVNAPDLSRNLGFLANDVYLFDQAACTSPHVVFFEKSGQPLREVARFLAEAFSALSARYPKQGVDQYTMTRIINARAENAMDLESDVLCSVENDWTILMNGRLRLEEPVESRTVFLKEVESIMDVVPLITRKVQTVGCVVKDKEKLLEFANAVTLRGVARCVNVGQMHLYDSPWDGELLVSRLVNWVSLYHGE